MSTVADELREYIESDVMEPGLGVSLTNEPRIWDEELIDSMGIMTLIAHIESEYDVAVDPEDVDVANFSSVNAIVAMVESKQ